MQRYTAGFRYEQGIPKDHIPRQRQIRIRVCNQHHSFIHVAVDVLENPGMLIRKQTEVMSAYARVPGARVLAVSLAPEDVVLNTRDIFDVHTRPDEVLGCRLRFVKNREGATLIDRWFAKHHGSANLGVIAVHLWRELGGYHVAFLKAALGGRPHAEYFGASGGDQHEIVLSTVCLEESLDFSDKFIFRHTGFSGFDEMPVSGVGKSRCLPDVFDFFMCFEAAQSFNGGSCGNRSLVDKSCLHEFPAGDGRLTRSQAVDDMFEIDMPTYVCIDCILKKLLIPGMRHHDRYAFAVERGYRVRAEEVEIDQRAEEVLARAISVKQQRVPSGFIHQA